MEQVEIPMFPMTPRPLEVSISEPDQIVVIDYNGLKIRMDIIRYLTKDIKLSLADKYGIKGIYRDIYLDKSLDAKIRNRDYMSEIDNMSKHKLQGLIGDTICMIFIVILFILCIVLAAVIF